jgi:hypothetical protein
MAIDDSLRGAPPSRRFCFQNRIVTGNQLLFSFGKSENGTFSAGGSVTRPYEQGTS